MSVNRGEPLGFLAEGYSLVGLHFPWAQASTPPLHSPGMGYSIEALRQLLRSAFRSGTSASFGL